ncbi:holo-ACP synthase [candidate division GN15 bacterium]|uniref:Holo-[acyl-carrier-protein] synthase n=1 Tax=candidate division GN15 bacterium TaxID=2072418 RepID=A0A855XBX1_9BACT|nr:MAG: holo-ACP synthase [candidate division GN15 bacterium]
MNLPTPPRVGIDLVAINRMNRLDSTPGLAEQLFTPAELSRCRARKRPKAALAACFAAKEAFLKASGLALHEGTLFSNIEIDCELPHRPHVTLHGSLKARFGESTVCHLSMGECRDLACAVVALEEKRIN